MEYFVVSVVQEVLFLSSSRHARNNVPTGNKSNPDYLQSRATKPATTKNLAYSRTVFHILRRLSEDTEAYSSAETGSKTRSWLAPSSPMAVQLCSSLAGDSDHLFPTQTHELLTNSHASTLRDRHSLLVATLVLARR